MTKSQPLMSMVALASLLWPLAAEGPKGEGRRGHRDHGAERMKRIDANGDGVLTQAEFLKPFQAMDKDGDGQVSASERQSFRDSKKGEMRSKFVQQRFAKNDSDGNGFIDTAEFKGPQDMFTKADLNGDGQLSVAEMEDGLKRMHGKLKKGQGGHFERMDNDGDGQLSQSEFKGPDGMFGKLDRNGDGFLTKDEARPLKRKAKCDSEDNKDSLWVPREEQPAAGSI